MATTAVSTANNDQAGNAPLPSRGSFGSALYPMRLLGTGTCIAVSGLYLFEFGGVRGWHLFLLGLALIYPHVSRYLSVRIEARKRLEYASVLVDAFILGSSVYIVAFSDVVMLSLLTVALANGMALGGARLMAACVASSGLAIALPAWAWGIPSPAGDLVIMDIVATVFLLFYFIMFASVANRRARLLRASRHEVRRQKADLEIEKRKSDGLLWALLPGALVNDVQAGREPAPGEYREVTLLAARVSGLDEAVSAHGANAVLAELNHCLKSFDEIAQRHGLEPWRVFGETWLAAAGAPDPEKSADAELAGREMRAFATQRAESQRHNDGVALPFAFAIHRGPAIGGLMHARRFSYELWGGILEGALDAVRRASSGEIATTKDAHGKPRRETAGELP
ncbi:MAG TPA: adenylate/guanylate cyclase domain-containing protein [Gammaproteobacteria bacterium]